MTMNDMRALTSEESQLLDLVRERTKLSAEWRQAKAEVGELNDRYLRAVDRRCNLEAAMKELNRKIMAKMSDCDEVPASVAEEPTMILPKGFPATSAAATRWGTSDQER